MTKNTEDWSAPQCGPGAPVTSPVPSGGGGGPAPGGGDIPFVPSANILYSVANADTLCSPGQCRPWSGSDVSSWTPNSAPTGVPACEPLSRVDGALFPGYATPVWVESEGRLVTPPTLTPPPAAFPDCLIIEDRSSSDPNWGEMTGATVPQVLRDKPNAKLFYKAFVINNCPWTTHLVFLVAGSKKASFDVGVVGPNRNIALPESEFTKAFTENTAPGRDFPSCWNTSGTDRPANCAKEISIEYNLNTYTCGSLGVQLAWWHLASSGGHVNDTRGLVSALNYGRDCSGSVAERAPGSLSTAGTGTTSSCPSVPSGSRLSPAVMGGTCGTTQNVVTWQNPTTPTQTRNTLFRNGYDASGNLLSSNAIFTEVGCWNGSGTGTGTFTDTNIPPLPSGSVYWYVIKTSGSPNVWSQNALKCGAGPVASPSPSSGVPPSTNIPSPTAVVIITPSPTPAAGSTCPDGSSASADLDCDGVANTTECPGYVPGRSIARCPDTNADGIADVVEPSVQNYGQPVMATASPAGAPGTGVGGVKTGPGDAVLLALVISAGISLAYVSYTRSPIGRRREIDAISKNGDPMDFRS